MTKIEDKVGKLLRAGTVHLDGTDLRTVNEATWAANCEELVHYVGTLVSPQQRRLALFRALEIRERMILYPAHEPAPTRAAAIATGRARLLSRFVELIR